MHVFASSVLAALIAPGGVAAAPDGAPPGLAAAAAEVAVDVDVQVNVRATEIAAPVSARSEAPVDLLRGDRWELFVRAVLGRSPVVADAAGPGGGVELGLGKQLGAMRLAVEAGYGAFVLSRDSLLDEMPGELVRFGATARFRATGTSETDGTLASGGAFVELASGWHLVRWRDGTEFSRPEVGIGAGFEGAWGRHRSGGIEAGVRVMMSESRTDGAYCASACRAAARDWGPDIAVLASIGTSIGW